MAPVRHLKPKDEPSYIKLHRSRLQLGPKFCLPGRIGIQSKNETLSGFSQR